MRIVGGVWGGRVLRAPDGLSTRPTSERVREALFSMLQRDVTDAIVLDLFAGSGCLAFEALSRGASSAVLVDSGRASQQCLRANIAALGTKDARLIPADAWAALRRLAEAGERFTLVFLDPPYAAGIHTKALDALKAVLAPGATIAVETDVRNPFDIPDGYAVRTDRRYGDTRIILITWEGSA